MAAASAGQEPYTAGGQRPSSRAQRDAQLSGQPDQDRGRDADDDFDDDCARSEFGNENFKVRPPAAQEACLLPAAVVPPPTIAGLSRARAAASAHTTQN